VLPYARWEELGQALTAVVQGKRVAMEVSPGNAVPYLDRVPWGAVQLVQGAGATVVSSGPLVTQMTARWSPAELEDHLFAAEALADIARTVIQDVVRRGGEGLRETEVQAEVIRQIQARGLVIDEQHSGPNVSFGPNAANPHYEPRPGHDLALDRDTVVLIDLWAGRSLSTVFADQTWMGFSGERPPEEVTRVWTVVRAARDAALERVWSAAAAKRPLSGFEVDQAAREVVESAGYGSYFVHRLGHSIDRDLHGSGPNLDNYETRDDRQLVPGVGFSVEPGIYLPGRFGVRSEVNVYWSDKGPRLTPLVPQRDLILP
jgi:Xaa-Pro aminopeptidase